MAAGVGVRTGARYVLECYMLLAVGVGLGLLTWSVHLFWHGAVGTSEPDPWAMIASLVLGVIGSTSWVPHAVALREWRRRRAALGAGAAGWGSTPTAVLATVGVGAAVLVLFALLKWPGLPAVVWLVPVGLLSVEAVVVLVRAFDERGPGAA